MTKEKLQKIFENINKNELIKTSKNLNIQSEDLSKTTLISKLVSKILNENKTEELYKISRQGIMLFYPYSYKNKRPVTEYKNFTIKGYKEVMKNFYQPDTIDNLFLKPSIFFENNKIYFIKKYHNNHLGVNKSYFENLLQLQLNPFLSDNIAFLIYKLIYKDLHYTKFFDKTEIGIYYVSHKVSTDFLKVTSKIQYMRAAKKEVNFDDKLASEFVNKKLINEIPDNIKYILNAPDITKENLEHLGINLYIKQDNKILRYALQLRNNEIKMVNIDTNHKDIVNASKFIKIITQRN